MNPEQAISALDAQIAAHGQTVTLRTKHDASGQSLGCKAFVRGFKPAELVGGLQQGDTLVVLSPNDVVGWADGIKTTNFIEIAGAVRSVKSVETVRMNDAVVRINVQVR